MNTAKKSILVLGATGQQGGATARQLVTRGWKVRALVRNSQSSQSQVLQDQGIKLVFGDLEQPATLLQAMENVYGVFSVQPLNNDPESELRQGKSVADAARQAHVAHLVYSSVIGADRDIGIPSFEAKGQVETYIQTSKLAATILRPSMFMDNFRFAYNSEKREFHLPYMEDLQTRIQMIATHDIGCFAALAFEQPEKFVGKVLEISGDELPIAEIIQSLHRYFDIPVYYSEPPVDVNQSMDLSLKANSFFKREGYQANIQELREIHPQLLSFTDWLNNRHLKVPTNI